jgi:hypothetical protein
MKMLEILKMLDREHQKKYGEVLIHNPEEAQKMGKFVLDFYRALATK